MFDSQPEGLGVAFFATGPGLGLIMYILTTLEFPTHNSDFHLHIHGFTKMPLVRAVERESQTLVFCVD